MPRLKKKPKKKASHEKLFLYRDEVSVAMIKKYGISWADACGDSEPLEAAMEEKQTPQEFVDWWGDKYDLDPVMGRGLW